MSDSIDRTPAPDYVAAIVRRGLKLDPHEAVHATEVGELANINYVYRVETVRLQFYLKIVPERPKRLSVPLPRQRAFSEAAGLRLFHQHAHGEVVIPEVLFEDREAFAFGMTDAGAGREVLFRILPDRLDLLVEQAANLGRALAAVHSATRGQGRLRPEAEETIIRKIVFDGLLAPGALQVFPEQWPQVRAEMEQHRECLIHSDLWSKNLLVRHGDPIALVDFEGVAYADPAFDLGTLVAVALVPALERPRLLPDAVAFTFRLLQTWSDRCGDAQWAGAVLPRTFRAAATFLAARGFGPFAYVLHENARERIRKLAASLAENPSASLDDFRGRAEAAE